MTIQAEHKRPLVNSQLLMLILFSVLTVLAISSFILPYGEYTYKKVTYSISGLNYFTGQSIANDTVTIEPQSEFYLGIAASVLFVVSAAFFFLKRKRISGTVLMVGGVLLCATPIVFMYEFNGLMSNVKGTHVLYGPYCTLGLGVLALVFGFYILYQYKTLNLLDVMVIPGLAYLIINNYIPMSGIVIAFKKLDYAKGIFASPWAGLTNFRFLFANKDMLNIIRNTICYNLSFIVLNNLFGIMVGIMLSEAANKAFQRFSQTIILLPQIISWVIVAYMVYGLLATNTGWINRTLLPFFGYTGANIPFYGKREYWPFILPFVSVWKSLGYNSIIYLSSIVGIDHNLYEAALIDGCGKLKQIRYITLPLLKPTVITLVIMALGTIMNSNFGLFYQITQNSGALYPVTQTLDVYIYRSIMETANLGMGSAAAALQSIVGFCLIISANALIRKIDPANALF